MNCLSSLSQVSRFIDYSKEANHPIQAGKYMLDSMNLYYESILQLIESIACIVESAGLKKMCSLLQEYAGSNIFLELKEKSRSLKERIESIYYNLTILSDRILLNFDQNENDFSEKIKNVFTPDKKDNNEFIFFRQITLTDLELNIADILYKKEKAFYQQRDQEHEAFAKKLAKDVRVLRIPEVTEPISDLQGLIRMAEILKEKGDSK